MPIDSVRHIGNMSSGRYGSEIADDKSYTVSFWLGTVNEKYYDAASVKTVDGKFEDLLTEYLKKKGSIEPEDTGRITLNW